MLPHLDPSKKGAGEDPQKMSYLAGIQAGAGKQGLGPGFLPQADNRVVSKDFPQLENKIFKWKAKWCYRVRKKYSTGLRDTWYDPMKRMACRVS